MTTRYAFVRCAFLFLLALAGFGCQSHTTPGHDPERARTVLVTALDAWKSGSPQSLATQSPPIRLQDDDLMAGLKLVSYELVNPKLLILPFNDVLVLLDLQDSRGKSIRKNVSYQVGLEPILMVQRSDN